MDLHALSQEWKLGGFPRHQFMNGVDEEKEEQKELDVGLEYGTEASGSEPDSEDGEARDEREPEVTLTPLCKSIKQSGLRGAGGGQVTTVEEGELPPAEPSAESEQGKQRGKARQAAPAGPTGPRRSARLAKKRRPTVPARLPKRGRFVVAAAADVSPEPSPQSGSD